MRIIISILSILQVVMLSFIQAQDIHWSQINQIQPYQNTSTIGEYEEDIKFTLAARDQWRSVTKPYQTYFGSIDTKLRKITWLSLGCYFLTDGTGDGIYKTNQINLLAKVGKIINSNLSISGGIDFGYVNKNLNFNNFKFDNQYDGLKYNGQLSTNESFTNSSFNNFTLGTGFSAKHKISNNHEVIIGVSYYNLNRPKESFYQLEIIRPIRSNYIVLYNYQINKQIFNSYVNFELQNSYRKLIFGVLDNLKVNNKKIKQIHFGISNRIQDAIILHLGISSFNTKIIFTYDVNTSKLKTASNGRGSLELNIQHLIKKKKLTYKITPSCIDYY